MKIFKKATKWILIIFIVLIGIIAIIPILFKDKITSTVKDEINKNMNAKVNFGDIDISLISTFPNLTFSINDISIIGIDEFAGDTLSNIEQFSLKIDLFSLMEDEFEIKSIIINKAFVHAQVHSNLHANWDIAKTDASSSSPDVSSDNDSFQLRLQEFKIIDSDIIYDDQSMDLYTHLKNFNFSLNGDLSADFSSLNTQTKIEEWSLQMDGVPYLKKVKTEIIANIDADLKNSKYTFNKNSFKLNELELGLNGSISMPKDDIDMDITYEAKQTEFKSILSLIPAIYMTDFKDIKTSGKLSLNGFSKGVYSDNRLPSFGLRLLIEQAMFQYPDMPGTANNINIDLLIDNKDGIEDHTIIDLKKFHVDFASNPFDMKMLITNPISDPTLDGIVKGEINLGKINETIPLDDMSISGLVDINMELKGKMSSIENEEYEKFHAIGNIDLQNIKYVDSDFPQGVIISKAHAQISPQDIELSNFQSKIGESDFQMTGRIENFLAYYFKDELLKGKFNLNSEFINLNEFSATEDETSSSSTVDTSKMQVIEIPKNIDFTLQTNIDKLLYDKLEITNIKGGVILKGGEAKMDHLQMNMLQGQMKMNGKYSSIDLKKPTVDFDLKITGFDIQQAFKAFNTVQKIAPIIEKCSGKFSMNFNMNSVLSENMEPNLSTLNSKGRFQTSSLNINNSDLFKKIGNLIKTDKFNSISLADIDFTYTIDKGNIHIKPFTTKFGKSSMTISGTQKLDQSINYQVRFKVPSSEFGSEANQIAQNLFSQAGQFGVDIQAPKNIEFTSIIGGTLSKPIIKLNLKDQAANMANDLKEQAKEIAKQEINKAKKEAIKKAKQQAAQLLAEADKQSKKIMKEANKAAQEIKNTANKNAEIAKAEVYKQADNLIKEAGNDMLKKIAAETAAKALRSEADKNTDKIKSVAAQQASSLTDKAQQKSNALKAKAKKEGDALIKKAETL